MSAHTESCGSTLHTRTYDDNVYAGLDEEVKANQHAGSKAQKAQSLGDGNVHLRYACSNGRCEHNDTHSQSSDHFCCCTSTSVALGGLLARGWRAVAAARSAAAERHAATKVANTPMSQMTAPDTNEPGVGRSNNCAGCSST